MKEAMYYHRLDDSRVQCELCPNLCNIPEGSFGSCRSRKNIEGKLIAVNYAQTTSVNLDPIEKKPLYHYHPGSTILSLGPNSCNLHCAFCQNFEISQEECPTKEILPDELLQLLRKHDLDQIAFTYTEPLTWYEYLLDCGKLFRENDIHMVLVSNGYINQAPLKELLPFIDAMNIDLKSSSDVFYKDTCLGSITPVLETIRTASALCHVEITNLLIPELNDTEAEIRTLVDFIADINPEIPLHFSRYFPRYKCKQEVTPENTLLKAYKIAKEKLPFVYLGNTNNDLNINTYCPSCGTQLIEREFNTVKVENLTNDSCTVCGTKIYGHF
jgi:pyruvate formate lyase activating enzyme